MPRPRNPETASAKSNQVIVSRLKRPHQKLEAEVTGLRNINEGLAGRVYRVSELEAMIERQQTHIENLEERLKACEPCHSVLTPLPTIPADDPKVTLSTREATQVRHSWICQVQAKSPFYPSNTTLIKAIKSVPGKDSWCHRSFEEAMVTDKWKAGAWIKAAIENSWRKWAALLKRNWDYQWIFRMVWTAKAGGCSD